jgi:hypothetical protein
LNTGLLGLKNRMGGGRQPRSLGRQGDTNNSEMETEQNGSPSQAADYLADARNMKIALETSTSSTRGKSRR